MEKSPFADVKFWITAVLSMVAGMVIAWIDSQPGWDDTGITAVMLFLASALAGFFSPKTPWLWALFCGIWIPVVVINRTGDPKSLFILLITLGGAYSGTFIRKIIRSARYWK